MPDDFHLVLETYIAEVKKLLESAAQFTLHVHSLQHYFAPCAILRQAHDKMAAYTLPLNTSLVMMPMAVAQCIKFYDSCLLDATMKMTAPDGPLSYAFARYMHECVSTPPVPKAEA